MKSLKLLLISLSIGFVGCEQTVNERGVNIGSSYEVLKSHVDLWRLIEPTDQYKEKEKVDEEKPMFRMKIIRDESVSMAAKCEKMATQDKFEACVRAEYDALPVLSVNLTNYMETMGYKELRDDVALRKVLNEAKRDGKIKNTEFQKIVITTQEIMNQNYEKQYRNNIANL